MSLYGLTPAAAKLLGEMADGFRNVRPPMGRPKRRVYPSGGSGLLLAHYNDQDAYLGSNDQLGVKVEGLITVNGDQHEVDASRLHQIIVPNLPLWVKREGGIYYAVAGAPGLTVLDGTIDADGNLATSVLGVGTITVSSGTLCGDSESEGQQVRALWTGSEFVNIEMCCP